MTYKAAITTKKIPNVIMNKIMSIGIVLKKFVNGKGPFKHSQFYQTIQKFTIKMVETKVVKGNSPYIYCQLQ